MNLLTRARSSTIPVTVGLALAATTLVFDLSLPLGVAGGVPYVAVVLVGLWAPRRAHVLGLASLGTVLTVAGYYASPEGGVPWVVLANRGLALLAIWMTALLIIAYRAKKDEALRQSERRFEAILEATPVPLLASRMSDGVVVYANLDPIRLRLARPGGPTGTSRARHGLCPVTGSPRRARAPPMDYLSTSRGALQSGVNVQRRLTRGGEQAARGAGRDRRIGDTG